MDIKRWTEEYNEIQFPKVQRHNAKLCGLLSSATLTDEEKAKVLLIGDVDWYPECHQWYLKFRKEAYDEAIASIVDHRIWDLPLENFSSFEDLYASISEWIKRPYVNQLTIYDVALRLVLARKEDRLKPQKLVYIHARPRKVYGHLYLSNLISRKPKDWNITVPIGEFDENFSSLNPYEPYIIEDFLCYIAKKGC